MPDTASVEPRDRLRRLIAEIVVTEQRLAALEEASTRACEQSWHVASQLAEAETELRRVTADERRRLAYAFVNNDGELADPVADARSRIIGCRAEVDRIAEVEAALAAEIAYGQAELQRLRASQHAAMSDIVCASPEYRALIEQHTAAWQNLRSIKQCLRVLVSSLKGQYPQRLEVEVSRAETLEGDRIGYPVNAEPARWAAALAALEQNADAELPQP